MVKLQPAEDDDPLLSESELARAYENDPSTIRRWRVKLGLPYERGPGGRIGYRKSAVLAWHADRSRLVSFDPRDQRRGSQP